MTCEMEVKKFSSKEEFEEWLLHSSYHVQQKAQKFKQIHGENVIPVVIIIGADTWGDGSEATHIFVHPEYLQYFLQYGVFEADNC